MSDKKKYTPRKIIALAAFTSGPLKLWNDDKIFLSKNTTRHASRSRIKDVKSIKCLNSTAFSTKLVLEATIFEIDGPESDTYPPMMCNARICGWFGAQRKTSPTTCAC